MICKSAVVVKVT